MNNSTARIQVPLVCRRPPGFPKWEFTTMPARGWRIAQRTAQRSNLSSMAREQAFNEIGVRFPVWGEGNDYDAQNNPRRQPRFFHYARIARMRRGSEERSAGTFLSSWHLPQGLTRFHAALAGRAGQGGRKPGERSVSAWELPRSLCASARYNGAERRR
jgi:hypothetical protein